MAVSLSRHFTASFASTTGLIVLTVSLLCGAAQAADPIDVELNSGRRLSGQIGSTSDQSNLHLRIGNSSLWIVQPIPWDRIQSAARNGEAVTIEDLRKEATRYQGLSDEELVPLPPLPKKELPPEELSTPQRVNPFANRSGSLKVSAINVSGVIANWDADVEPDGVIVNVRPLDQQGAIIPAAGTLQLVLVGTRRGRRSFHASEMTRADDVSQIGRWTRKLRMQDIGPRGAFIKLPFGATHPDFDPAVGDIGLIHARLAVPGVGVFEDARDNVLIRSPGFTRDAFERGAGQRFLPFEQTGRGVGRGSLTYPSIRP